MTSASPAESARLDGLYELAFRRHQAGELTEAEQLYRSILEADPRQLDCLHLLGTIALQRGRPDAALALIGQAIAANDRIAAYHGSIAEAYRALDRRDEAIEHYSKAVTIDPQYWAAHSMLADLLRKRGDSGGAIEHYAKAVVSNPDLTSARHNLAALLYEQGRTGEALDAIWRACAANETGATRALFVQCVRGARTLPGDPGFRLVLTRALGEVWGRPVELALPALALIRAEPLIASAIQSVESIWPQRVAPGALGPCVRTLTGNQLLHHILETTPVCDSGIERLLACVRTLLMDAALHATTEISPEMLPLACALARQCFINEYVFHVPDVERAGAAALRDALKAALAGPKPPFAISLIAYACYEPLHTLESASAILAREWPPAMAGLLTQQLHEPREEAVYRAELLALTDILDDVSLRVRQQYEGNPYPRWTRIAPVQTESSIVGYLRGAFPSAPVREVAASETLDILIAGCGTGQQPIEAALRFPQAHVIGIDLSRASLAYAQRKAAEANVTNVQFAQGDISALNPDHAFDTIEASGVLHHMADPIQSWAQLLRLLKRGGFMRLGFYSRLARRDIVGAREFVAAGGYDTTTEGIRRCREAMLKARDPGFQSVFRSPDFYSVSGCRDLLFHVEEHLLTLPQIAAFLEQHRLSFLGFELGSAALAQYRTRFGEEVNMTDLARWHLFESEHPDTFGGMYQFWVQSS